MGNSRPTTSTSPSEALPPSVIRRQKRRRHLLVLMAVFTVACGGVYLWFQGEEAGPETEPLIVSAEIGSIENTIAASGSLQPSNFVDVGAQVSGQLQTLHVEVGDEVSQGELLAEIDARVQQARVDASRASIEALEAQLMARRASLELAKANLERQTRLMEANATSQLDYDNAVTSLASAESSLIQLEKQIQQSRASLASDETQLEFSNIFAPVDGTVVSIEMNEGRTLNANQQAPTILRIADMKTMTVETQISEADIADIKKGMPVYFTTLGSAGRRWYGEVRQILPTPTIDNNVVLYTGLFDIENTDGVLLPDMTAQVYFITSSAENVLTVPLGALTFVDEAAPGGQAVSGPVTREGGPQGGFMRPGQRPSARPASAQGSRRLATVTVVDEQTGLQTQKEVVVGVTSRIAAEIISGLKVGDQVVAGLIQTNLSVDGNDDRGGGFRFRGF